MEMSLDEIIVSNRTVGRGEAGGKMYQRHRTENRSSQNPVSRNYYNNSSSFAAGKANANYKNAKVIVSNLDVVVDESDIQQLFEEIGHLIWVKKRCDQYGRSLGMIEILFERRIDALKAIKQYNGVPLDGLPMKIELDRSKPPMMSHRSHNQSVERYEHGAANRMRGDRNYKKSDKDADFSRNSTADQPYRQSGPRKGDIHKAKRSDMTAADLDAELDAYVQESTTKKAADMLK